MVAKKHSFDPECLTLAEYFYPTASKDRLYDLAQRIQDQVEAEDIDGPAAAPETRTNDLQCACRDGYPRCAALVHRDSAVNTQSDEGYDANGSSVVEPADNRGSTTELSAVPGWPRLF